MKKEHCFKFENSDQDIKDFINYIKENKCKDIILDLSCLSFFDALKFAALSSAYHFQEYPNGKLSYKNSTEDFEMLVSEFSFV